MLLLLLLLLRFLKVKREVVTVGGVADREAIDLLGKEDVVLEDGLADGVEGDLEVVDEIVKAAIESVGDSGEVELGEKLAGEFLGGI